MPHVASPTSRLPPVWAMSPMLFFAVSRSSSLYTLSVSHCAAGLLSVRSAVCCHLLREFVCLWSMGIARIELLYFLTLYLVSIPLQLVTTSSFLHQGSTALIAVTAVHAGIVAALFWCLLGECIVLFTSFCPLLWCFLHFRNLCEPLALLCFSFVLLSHFRSWRSTPGHHNHGISLDFYHYCYGITHLHDSFFSSSAVDK